MSTLSGNIAGTVRPIGYQSRVWPHGGVDLDELKKKKRRKKREATEGLDLDEARKSKSKKLGPDLWELNGKKGKWRNVQGGPVFYPSDGSAAVGVHPKVGKASAKAKGKSKAKGKGGDVAVADADIKKIKGKLGKAKSQLAKLKGKGGKKKAAKKKPSEGGGSTTDKVVGDIKARIASHRKELKGFDRDNVDDAEDIADLKGAIKDSQRDLRKEKRRQERESKPAAKKKPSKKKEPKKKPSDEGGGGGAPAKKKKPKKGKPNPKSRLGKLQAADKKKSEEPEPKSRLAKLQAADTKKALAKASEGGEKSGDGDVTPEKAGIFKRMFSAVKKMITGNKDLAPSDDSGGEEPKDSKKPKSGKKGKEQIDFSSKSVKKLERSLKATMVKIKRAKKKGGKIPSGGERSVSELLTAIKSGDSDAFHDAQKALSRAGFGS